MKQSEEVIKEGIIRSGDITRLGFLDWSRSVISPDRDIRGLEHWLKGQMKYTLIRTNMQDVPTRSDFPGWNHIGHHVSTAQEYWNWFHYQFWDIPEKELVFADSPDFWGSILFPSEGKRPEQHTRFWGDIGQASVIAFLLSFLQMCPGDLWITLKEDNTQLILEAQTDFFALSGDYLDSVLKDKKSGQSVSLKPLEQLSLW